MTASSWHEFTTRIPSIFFNPTLRFLLLRTICVSSVLLTYNVPKDLRPRLDSCARFLENHFPHFESIPVNFRVYFYTVCFCTFFHHLASAFGLTLPGIVDFPLIIGEAVAFLMQAITRQWASPIPTTLSSPPFCEMDIEQATIPNLSAWLISICLVVIAVMRFAEALESNGRYLWATYDITGCKITPRRTHYNQRTRPNGFKVIAGVHIWTDHFMGEGRWFVRSRGITALFLMIVAMTFAFSTVIVDPVDEGAAPPVKVTRTLRNPRIWDGGDLYVIVGLNQWNGEPIDFSDAITTKAYFGSCPLNARGRRTVSNDGYPSLLLLTFLCKPIYGDWNSVIQSSSVSVAVNYTALFRALGESDRTTPSLQVMIGHYNDSLAVVRRTEAPVVLLPGLNLLGFAQQHVVQQFRSPVLATLGFSVSYEEFLVSEIIHLQTNPEATASSNDTASLVVYPRMDFSDMKIVQDYREKTVLKGFASVGGLWTVLIFFFGALFGSSLVHVVFGVKPLSIFGFAHMFSETTKRKYRGKYSNINPQTINKGNGLDALLINHLVDVDLFSEDVTRTVLNTGEEQTRNDASEMEQVDSELANNESSSLVTATP